MLYLPAQIFMKLSLCFKGNDLNRLLERTILIDKLNKLYLPVKVSLELLYDIFFLPWWKI